MKKPILFILMILPAVSFAQYKIGSQSTSGKKTTITTQYDDGYVILNTGEEKKGRIQLKIVNNDTTEIRMKLANKEKLKFSRYDVSEFGLDAMKVDEVRVAKNPIKNFQPGYIILQSGDRLEGKVACRSGQDQINQGFVKTKVMLQKENGDVITYSPEEAKIASQMIDGKAVIHEQYKGVFVQRIVDGNLLVMRNPFPTTKSGLGTALAQSAMEDANQAIATESLKAGADIDDVAANYNAMASQEVNVYQKEYLVKKASDSDYQIIIKKKYNKGWAADLFSDCSAYSSLDAATQKSYTKYANIEAALAFYSKSCGD